MKVEMRWSLDVPGTQAMLLIPNGITLPELDELDEAIGLQLKAVRRSLEAEATRTAESETAAIDEAEKADRITSDYWLNRAPESETGGRT